MDLQTGLVCAGLVVVSAFVILLISMLSMKGKTYEEAIAEQRKLPDDLLSGKKEKSKEKKHKNKAGKKVKEKKEEKEEKEEIEEEKSERVQFEENPQILTGDIPLQEEKVSKSTKKKGKNERVKPILVNKEEPIALVPDLSTSPAEDINHFEQLLPKDDLELIRSQSKENLLQTSRSESPLPKSVKDTPTKSKKTSKDNAKKNGSVKEDKNAAAPNQSGDGPKDVKDTAPLEATQLKETPEKEVKEAIKESTAPVQSTAKESKNKKKRHDILAQIGGDKDGVNISLLSPLVEKAELSRSEIQILINQLLNKQLDNPSEHSEWIDGRTDPVLKLKKQLADKEKALEEEREESLGFQNCLKKLRAELNSEKGRLSASVRQLEEALSTKVTEAQTLHTRMQHILETHAAEKQGFARQIEQLQSTINDNVSAIHKMQEDQGQTQGHLQQELIAQRKQLEVQFAQIREKDNALETQLAQKHTEAQELQNLNLTRTQELQILQTTCDNNAAEIDMLRQQLAIMQEQLMHSDKQLQHFKENGARLQDAARQLEESRHAQNELEVGLQTARRHEQELLKQINSMKSELQAASTEAKDAASLKLELQSVQAELNNWKSSLSISQSEMQTELSQSESELIELRDKLKNVGCKLSKLESDLSVARRDLEQSESKFAAARDEATNLNSELTKTRSDYKKLQADYSVQQEELKNASQIVNDLKTLNAEMERLQQQDKKFNSQVNVANLQAEIDRLSLQSKAFDQLQKEVSQLREENESLKSKLAASISRVESQAEENNIEKQALKNNIQLNDHNNLAAKNENALGELRLELAEKDAQLSQLDSQLQALQRDITHERNVAKHLKSELAVQQAKNDKLRTRNWKAMEALSAAESRANSRPGINVDDTSKNIRIEEQKNTEAFLQRLFPEMKISKTSHDEWMHLFEQNVKSLLEKIRSSQTISDVDEDLEKQNQSLQGMVTHYKQIIEDTDGMLTKLQNHIESEEARWQAEFQQKDIELAGMKAEVDELRGLSRVTEELKSKILELEDRLSEVEAEKSEILAELLALRKVRESSFIKGSRSHALMDEFLENEMSGGGSSSDQSIPNGAPTSESSKSESTLAARTLIAALEKTPRNTELAKCSVTEPTVMVECRAESGDNANSVISKTSARTSPEIDQDSTQANWNPSNGHQHKKHKKKRKGGSGKK